MLKLATVLDNPGEPLPQTRYRDPRHLKELGYNGLVLYKTTGLSGVEEPDAVGSGEMRRWVQHQFELVERTLDEAVAAGLDVYITYDALSLARDAVDRDAALLSCKNRPEVLCPASEATVQRSVAGLESLLSRWPQVRGVVLRFGDNDAARLRYLVGNDIYTPHCPRCSVLGRVDRVALVLERFHDLVVRRADRLLIARAWNVRPHGMHDSVDVCERLRDRLPGDEQDDRFILSFKFTETDFWRYQRWNPSSLVFGRRPIVYELQCQREFEGKGGVPNWQVPLWRNGYPETRGDGPTGLAEVAGRIHLAGLWAWVRGGGWGGPFVKNEAWIDANVVAVPQLAEDPTADPDALAHRWVEQRLGLGNGAVARAIETVLTHSPDNVLRGFYIAPYARTKGDRWHPNGDWIQDDLVDAQAAWRMIQRVPEAELDEVVREKQQAVDQVSEDQHLLHQVMNKANRGALEPMANMLVYTGSLFETLRDLLAGLVAYRRHHNHPDAATAEACRRHLLAAQTHWNHHTQRHGAIPGVATAFRETHFWELTQRILSEVS